MLDIKYIRENSDKVEEALARRNGGLSLSEVLKVDKEQRDVQLEWEEINRRRNELNEIFKMQGAKLSSEEKQTLKDESAQLKARGVDVTEKKKELDEKIESLILTIPNIPDATVPDGKDETDNEVISVWGEKPVIEKPKHHYELGTELGIFDFERGVKIAQSRFTVLMNWGARIERALMNFMLDHHGARGYVEVFPPILINRNCMIGTGQLPKFEGDFYKCEDEDLYLVPTAEVPITNLYREEVLDEDLLTISHCGYTPNFRREAGAAGKDTRGYIRQHQFNKIELVKFTTPENSVDEHEKLTRDAESILEALGLHYRRIALCAGDLGFCARKCFDLEVWFPAQNQFREISSCSNFGDFQARRAGIRYKPKEGGKPRFIHTINGSGLAIGRTLAAILENYQQPDGSLKIPDVLVPYLGGIDRVSAKE